MVARSPPKAEAVGSSPTSVAFFVASRGHQVSNLSYVQIDSIRFFGDRGGSALWHRMLSSSKLGNLIPNIAFSSSSFIVERHYNTGIWKSASYP